MRRIRVCALAGLALAGCQSRTASEQTARVAQLEKENAELRDSLARKSPAPLAAKPEPPAKAAETVRIVREAAPAPAHGAEDLAAIQQLRASLNDSRNTIAELQARVEKLDGQVLNMMAERQRLLAAEAEAGARLAAAGRSIEAMQKEVRQGGERLAQLEQANRKLREDSGAQGQRAAQMAKTLAELEDIERRRQNFSTSLARRYREVMEQYRSLSATIEHRRSSDAAAVGLPDLSRIQQAISLAEEDLRQLAALSAQAQLVQKKLMAAK